MELCPLIPKTLTDVKILEAEVKNLYRIKVLKLKKW